MRIITLGLLFMITPVLMGAGSESASTPSVGKHEKYYNKGVDAQNQKDYVEAVKWYGRALEEKPDYADAHNNLGFSLRSIGREYLHRAGQAYDDALQADANHAEALEYQGELYLWTGQITKARGNLDRLKALNSPEAQELEKQLKRILDEAQKLL